MPYRRRYNRRRRRAIPRNIFYKRFAKKGYRLARTVYRLKSLINTEFKSKDITISATPTTTETFTLLNGLTKGDDIENREGRQVRFKSINTYLDFSLNPVVNNTRVRWCLLLDKQPNTAAIDSSTGVFSNDIAGIINLTFRRRFWFIASGVIKLNADYPNQDRKRYKRVNFKTIYNNADNGTIADITTNALYLYLVSDQATNSPSVTGLIRVRFLDN